MSRTEVNGQQRVLVNEIAEAYQTLDDGSPCQIPRPHEDGRTMMAAASGIRSNVNDLLKFYQSVLDLGQTQFFGEKSVGAGVLKQLPTILSNHQVMSAPSYREKSYGLAWGRAQFPVDIGDIGTNPGILSPMPVVAQGTNALSWWHQGSLVSFTSFVALLPEHGAAVDSTALNDSADWIGQLLLETVLESPERNDYVHLAKKSAWIGLEQAKELEKMLNKGREHGTKSRPLGDYSGTYTNAAGNFAIDVLEEDNALKIAFQGRHSQTYSLNHYHRDTFCWYLPRNEQVRRARWFITDPDLYKILFECSDDKVDRLVWKFDPEIAEGAVFRKSGSWNRKL